MTEDTVLLSHLMARGIHTKSDGSGFDAVESSIWNSLIFCCRMETVNNQYLGGDASLTCSAETQAQIDREVVKLVKTQHDKAAQILMENREKLDQLSRHLYEKETITGEEFMRILNT